MRGRSPGRRRLLLGMVSVSALMTGAPALAEGAKTSGPAALEEVVVTAQRREQNLQAVPAAVTAVSGEKLDARATGSLEGLARGVPTLAVGNLGLSGQYFLRGVGSGSNLSFEQSLGVYLDGIYFSTPRLNRLAFMDQERVEILRGPQSTLYAKGTIAGAITVASAKPSRDAGYAVNALAGLEGGDQTQISGFLTGPLSSTLSGRIAVLFNDENGSFHNSFKPGAYPRTNQKAARASLRWEPTDKLTVDGMFQYALTKSEGRAAQIGAVSPLNTTFIPAVRALDPKAEFKLDDNFSAYDTPSVAGRDEVYLASLTGAYALDDVTLRSVSSIVNLTWYEFVDSDNTPLPILNSSLGGTLRQFSQEFRAESSTEGPLQYIAGAYYQRSEFGMPPGGRGYTEWYPAPSVRTTGVATRTEKTLGVFGQLTWSPIEHLRLTAGARYQASRIYGFTSRWVSAPGTNVPTINPVLIARGAVLGTVAYTFEGTRKEDSITPAVTLEYDLADGVMAYASYRTGFKNGGFDLGRGTFTSDFVFRPEKARSYEGGVKSMLFDRRLRLNLTVFRTNIDDLQVSAFNGTTFTVGNAASARTQGAELDADARVSTSLSLRANVSYLDAKYLDFPGSSCYATQTAAQGCVDLDPGPAVRPGQNLAGYTLQYAPKWSGNLGFDFTHPVASRLQLFASGDLTYKGSQAIAPDGNPVWVRGRAAKLDLRVGIGAEDGRWQLALLGKNLTDIRTANFGFNVPLNTGAYVFSADPPRTIALQLRLRN